MLSQLYTTLLAFASGHYSMSHILKYLRQIRNSIIHVPNASHSLLESDIQMT